MAESRKLLYWEGSSKKDFKQFPVPVQKDMGIALFVVQLGRTPESAKPLKGLGSGVYELVGDHEMTRKKTLQGTDNVLADLGFEDAEELSAKVVLAVKLNDLVDRRGLNQTEAANITGMTQPKISQVKRYKLQNISLERLMQALVSLDQEVEIVVRPAPRSRAAGIKVAA